jgi:hypothetical protein
LRFARQLQGANKRAKADLRTACHSFFFHLLVVVVTFCTCRDRAKLGCDHRPPLKRIVKSLFVGVQASMAASSFGFAMLAYLVK